MSVTFSCGEGMRTDESFNGPDLGSEMYWARPEDCVIPDWGIADSPYQPGDFERSVKAAFIDKVGAMTAWVSTMSPFHRSSADGSVPHAWLH